MKRFCPFDGDELVPLTLAWGRARRDAVEAGASAAGGIAAAPSASSSVASVELMGKICPHCSRRYESDATFCGRDGAALVSVN